MKDPTILGAPGHLLIWSKGEGPSAKLVKLMSSSRELGGPLSGFHM